MTNLINNERFFLNIINLINSIYNSIIDFNKGYFKKIINLINNERYF
jgi:hypothetical protein